MKKYILDLTVNSVEALSDKHVLIKLTDDKPLPEMLPGQFVEVRVDNSPSTFLRRPISINNVDYDHNELWLLVAAVRSTAHASCRSCRKATASTACCHSAIRSQCRQTAHRRCCS